MVKLLTSSLLGKAIVNNLTSEVGYAILGTSTGRSEVGDASLVVRHSDFYSAGGCGHDLRCGFITELYMRSAAFFFLFLVGSILLFWSVDLWEVYIG